MGIFFLIRLQIDFADGNKAEAMDFRLICTWPISVGDWLENLKVFFFLLLPTGWEAIRRMKIQFEKRFDFQIIFPAKWKKKFLLNGILKHLHCQIEATCSIDGCLKWISKSMLNLPYDN